MKRYFLPVIVIFITTLVNLNQPKSIVAQLPTSTPSLTYLPTIITHRIIQDCSDLLSPINQDNSIIRIPSQPKLIAPLHQTTLTEGTPVLFQWHSDDACKTEARHYTFQIASDPEFEQVLLTLGYLSDDDTIYTDTSFYLLRAEIGQFYWRVSALEETYRSQWSDTYQITVIEAAPNDLTVITTGQGFDTCHAPTIEQLSEWKQHSPYQYLGIYLGGESHYAPCKQHNQEYQTVEWFMTVVEQGWQFIPIWVGPQAPCTDFNIRMSDNPTISRQQGIEAAIQANQAADLLGLTNNQQGQTIIYYDMEAYQGDSNCETAVRAFLTGWLETLQDQGHKAGIYSLARQVNDWYRLTPPPDSTWSAWFMRDGYDPNLTIDTLHQTWVEAEFWDNSHLHQYSGSHVEQWGNVSLEIDNNVAKGWVAGRDNNRSPPAVQAMDFVSADKGWLVMGQELFWTDDAGNQWRNITPLSIDDVQTAYFLDNQYGWVVGIKPNKAEKQVYLNEHTLKLAYSTDGGVTWQSNVISIKVNEPIARLQLQFVDRQIGWLNLTIATSINFSRGLLFKTTDGGQTWQPLNIPIGGDITFINQQIGWLKGGVLNNLVYRSEDGGATWQNQSSQILSQSQQPIPTITVWFNQQIGWKYHRQGNCHLHCTIQHHLLKTEDGGKSWQHIQLPDE